MVAKSIGLFTLPIYTRIFTPSDYGTIEMLVVISSFFSALLMMGMESAQSMYFFKHKKDGKHIQGVIISSILQWKLIFGILLLAVFILLSPILNQIFFNSRLTWQYFMIAFSCVLFSQVMTQSSEVMRLLYRPWAYLGITLSKSVLAPVVVLIAVLSFDQGIAGFFIGPLTASLLIAVYGWFKLREYLIFNRIHYEWWPTLLKFGAPLVPAGLAMYFMSTADRWFVQFYHGEEALGLFAIGAKFALLMTLVIETFRKAWWPIALDSMHSKDGPETFRLIAKHYVCFGSIIIIILTLISQFLIRKMTSIDYYQAWPLISVLSFSSLFYGFFLIVSAGIWKSEKTKFNFYLIAVATLVGVILNYLIVPNHGIMGASVSTALTFFILAIMTLVISERYWKVDYYLIQMTASFTVPMCFVYWYLNKHQFNILKDITIGLILCGIIIILNFHNSLRGIGNKFKF